MDIVLDKSALVSASTEELRNFCRKATLVLTSTLQYEIATGPGEMRRNCEAHLQGINAVRVHELGVAVRWELENGRSSKDLGQVPSTRAFFHDGWFETDANLTDHHEGEWAKLASIGPSSEEAALVAELGRMRPPEFYDYLARLQATLPIAKLAAESWTAKRAELGVTVCRSLKPRPDWVIYGAEKVAILGGWWKFWRYDDNVAHKESPANFGLDLAYVTYMALADGLLSCEKNLLDFAWACWPEKRSGLLIFDQEAREVRAYQPGWFPKAPGKRAPSGEP